MSTTDIKSAVKQKYGEAASRVRTGGSSCCGASAATGCADPITSNLYDSTQAGQVPEEALLASLGCGNPTALAKLNAGEVVLDLGSGGGIDVLLSAQRVGPTGRAYGLDMTNEMLALANQNKRTAGMENVEFLKGCFPHHRRPQAPVGDTERRPPQKRLATGGNLLCSGHQQRAAARRLDQPTRRGCPN